MTNGLRHARQVVAFIWTNPSNRGERLRRLGAAVRFQLAARLLRRPVTVVRFGERSKLRAELHVHNSTKPLYARVPDFPEMTVWGRVLRPGAVFVDVGANVGLYSVLAAERGATVIAVEPDDDARARLQANLALNGYSAEIVPAALSAESGTARMTVGRDEENRMVGEGQAGRAVTARTLDDVLGDRTADGVKIDVEGAERQVLAGATRALRDKRLRLVQLEWNWCARQWFGESRLAVAELLAAHGYELCAPQPDGSLRPVTAPEESVVDLFARPVERTAIGGP